MRYSVLGILVLAVAVGLAIEWRVNHILFGIVLGLIGLCTTVVVVARDGSPPEGAVAAAGHPAEWHFLGLGRVIRLPGLPGLVRGFFLPLARPIGDDVRPARAPV
jgi:hypothetical protein